SAARDTSRRPPPAPPAPAAPPGPPSRSVSAATAPPPPPPPAPYAPAPPSAAPPVTPGPGRGPPRAAPAHSHVADRRRAAFLRPPQLRATGVQRSRYTPPRRPIRATIPAGLSP